MRKILIGVCLALALLLSTAGPALAGTSALDWNLFKLYNSPAWVWGVNGAIITPTPNVAPNGFYLSGYIVYTGTYNYEPAAFSTNTLTLSTGNLEIGLTKKYLLLNWERLDVDSTILHLKFQPFVTKFVNIAAGTVAVQIGPNPFAGTFEDTFFNDVFVVAGLQLGPIYLNGGAEIGLIGSEQTEPFYFVNGKIKLGDKLLIAEAIATDAHGQGGIYNVGLASANKRLNWGVAVLDVAGIDFANLKDTVQLTGFLSFRY